MPDDNSGGGRCGWEGVLFLGAGTGGSEALLGLDEGTKDEGGLDRTSGDSGQFLASTPLQAHPQPRCRGQLLSAFTPSVAFYVVVGSVASSRTWSDGLGSWSVVALAISSREPAGNGDPFLTMVHSTKVVKFAQGPSLEDGALYIKLKLVS